MIFRFIFSFIISMLLYGNVYAKVSKAEAITIYKNIIKSNNMLFYPKLVFNSSRTMNAHQFGWTISINSGMLDNTTIDELALVIGHELGHFTLGHMRSNHQNEYSADFLGWKYATKAQYNMCKGIRVFKKFKQRASDTHPHPVNRIKRLPRC